MAVTSYPQQPILVEGVRVGVVQAFPGRNRNADDGNDRWQPGDGQVWRAFQVGDGNTRVVTVSALEHRSAADAEAAFLASFPSTGTDRRLRRRKRVSLVGRKQRNERLRTDRLHAALAEATDGHTVTLGDRTVVRAGTRQRATLYRYVVLLDGAAVGTAEAVRVQEDGPKTRGVEVTHGQRVVTRWVGRANAVPDRTTTMRTLGEAAAAVAGLTLHEAAAGTRSPAAQEAVNSRA